MARQTTCVRANLVLVAGVLLCLCGMASAQNPGGPMSPPPGPPGMRPPSGMPGMDGPGGRNWGARGQRPGAEGWRDFDIDRFWPDASAFAQKVIPYRMGSLEKIDRANPEYDNIRRFIVMRYLFLARLKDEDPALYDIRTKQMTVEDQLFNALTQPPADGTDRATVLRPLVQEAVRLDLEERTNRLRRLEEMLTQERQRLQADEARMETMVNDRVRSLESEGVDALRPRMNRFGREERWREWMEQPAGRSGPSTRPAKGD